MSLEIEKKFAVSEFDQTLKMLRKDFGPYTFTKKAGFWWAGNFHGLDHILELGYPRIGKSDVEVIKNIGEFALPAQDFQFIRLRISNKTNYIVTFKTKTLVNNIEQNTEYEFNVDLETFKSIKGYCEDKLAIFYYNIKEIWKFRKGKVTIELSKLSNLRKAYLEIEIVGDNKRQLTAQLNKALTLFSEYSLKEETRNFVDLFRQENKQRLKQVMLNGYSRDALKELNNLIYEDRT